MLRLQYNPKLEFKPMALVKESYIAFDENSIYRRTTVV